MANFEAEKLHELSWAERPRRSPGGKFYWDNSRKLSQNNVLPRLRDSTLREKFRWTKIVKTNYSKMSWAKLLILFNFSSVKSLKIRISADRSEPLKKEIMSSSSLASKSTKNEQRSSVWTTDLTSFHPVIFLFRLDFEDLKICQKFYSKKSWDVTPQNPTMPLSRPKPEAPTWELISRWEIQRCGSANQSLDSETKGETDRDHRQKETESKWITKSLGGVHHKPLELTLARSLKADSILEFRKPPLWRQFWIFNGS